MSCIIELCFTNTYIEKLHLHHFETQGIPVASGKFERLFQTRKAIFCQNLKTVETGIKLELLYIYIFF